MKLSVVTINYNNRDGLRKTIESVVNQTYKDFEYIVIDGGSTDGSVDVIKEYADRIDYWVSEPDKGIYNAMNKGIDVAKGEYCIFLNSGDIFSSSDIIDECVPFLDGTDIVAGYIQTDSGLVWGRPKELTLAYFYEKCSLPHPASFITTSLLKKYRYDENLKIVSDWKFFIQVIIIDNCRLKSIDVIVSVFDTNGISLSNFNQISNESDYVLEEMFPKRLLDDYRMNTTYDFRKLFFEIEKSKMHRLIYVINVVIIKLLNLFTGRAEWIRDFSIKEKFK